MTTSFTTRYNYIQQWVVRIMRSDIFSEPGWPIIPNTAIHQYTFVLTKSPKSNITRSGERPCGPCSEPYRICVRGESINAYISGSGGWGATSNPSYYLHARKIRSLQVVRAKATTDRSCAPTIKTCIRHDDYHHHLFAPTNNANQDGKLRWQKYDQLVWVIVQPCVWYICIYPMKTILFCDYPQKQTTQHEQMASPQRSRFWEAPGKSLAGCH